MTLQHEPDHEEEVVLTQREWDAIIGASSRLREHANELRDTMPTIAADIARDAESLRQLGQRATIEAGREDPQPDAGAELEAER